MTIVRCIVEFTIPFGWGQNQSQVRVSPIENVLSVLTIINQQHFYTDCIITCGNFPMQSGTYGELQRELTEESEDIMTDTVNLHEGRRRRSKIKKEWKNINLWLAAGIEAKVAWPQRWPPTNPSSCLGGTTSALPSPPPPSFAVSFATIGYCKLSFITDHRRRESGRINTT